MTPEMTKNIGPSKWNRLCPECALDLLEPVGTCPRCGAKIIDSKIVLGKIPKSYHTMNWREQLIYDMKHDRTFFLLPLVFHGITIVPIVVGGILIRINPLWPTDPVLFYGFIALVGLAFVEGFLLLRLFNSLAKKAVRRRNEIPDPPLPSGRK